VINTAAKQRSELSREAVIGQVASRYLRNRLSQFVGSADDGSDGTARFIIDCLTPVQAAAIAAAILSDAEMSARCEVKLPVSLVGGLGLPESAMTAERATYFRNAPCAKEALLIANTGDDEEQSLRELTAVGALELQGEPVLWVDVASDGLVISEEERNWWPVALRGLQELRLASLDRFADYVLRTRSHILIDGFVLTDALDAALPTLRLPRNAGEFSRIAPRFRGQYTKWRSQYLTVAGKRGCYLSKQTPTGVILGADELRTAFDRVRDDIPEGCHTQVADFIAAPAGWTPESAALAECDWEDVKPLFDGLRREKFNLGQVTLDFYSERNPELVSDEEREYLQLLSRRRTTEAALDDDREFHDGHRDELREDRKLKSAWDRFIYGAPRETFDFLGGLAAALERLSWEAPTTRRTLVINCESRFKRDFRDLNVEAGMYFARRYGGLKELFGRDVVWNVGELFGFASLVDAWRKRGQVLNRSEARAALQLKFTVTLEFDVGNGDTDRSAAQFFWRYNPNWIQSEFLGDWERLAAHPLVACSANREPTSSKGSAQGVDIWKVRTLMPAHGQDRGSLVGIYRIPNDLGRRWRSNLAEALERGLISREEGERAGELFEEFSQRYSAAIQGFVADGLASAELELQVTAYGALLEYASQIASNDRTRQLLVRPLLEIGAVPVVGGRPTVIVAPWHPLRIASMVRKARRVGNLLHDLRTAREINFGDISLFFRELRDELAHAHYPEVALGWQGDHAELLSLTDTAGDYTLHESPFAADAGADDTNENPEEGADRVTELVRRYLALHPHEQANLSVVLYNCDSSRLPLAVVEKLAALHQDEDDIRCQVVLRHRDPKQLAWLYEQIVDSSDDEGDALVASETTRDFMARLRIGISADLAPPPDPRDGCPDDIVFSQDVIARHARLEWYLEEATPADPQLLNPAQWSRRRPVATGDMKSVVYLCCPVQRAEGWSYLSATSAFFRPQAEATGTRRLIPARQLDFRDLTTARIFDETHNLATWVANYDELLDRRQLVEQGVRIIRYKQIATQGRNLIVSSRTPTGLLRSMVVSRLRDLNLGFSEAELHGLADRFIADANEVSGDIVLRAAQRGRSASELMGLVLSRYLIRYELDADHQVGWFFLDDYADWLGQQEEHIADLLALSPRLDADGSMRLIVVISEAKYIDAANLSAKRKESQKQLRDTLRRVAGAVIDSPVRLDRDIWLARLSDLLVDGMVLSPGSELDLPAWRRALRDGVCHLELRGYSHVFISGPLDSADPSVRSRLPELEGASFDAYQEIFGRDRVRQLIRAYRQGVDPTPIRLGSEGDELDGGGTPPNPTDDVPPGDSGGGERLRPDTLPGADEDEVRSVQDAVDGPVARSAESTVVGASDATGVEVASHEESDPWPYPGISGWLAEAPSRDEQTSDDLVWLRQAENTTKLALHEFHLQAKLLRSVLTPNAALLKFRGSQNLTVDQVLRRRSEFLTTHGLDLIGVQPEAGVVSLSIARPHREVVGLRTLWKRWRPDSAGGNAELLLGVREDDGEPLLLSPGDRHAPHTLIAGSTGSGKSVLMQNIILGIAATNRPNQARITLVDPKQGVDYFAFEDLPHLDGGIIDQQDQALTRIKALVQEMDARYVLMRRARSANLKLYNERVEPADRLPTLWLIHDEFAEWMLTEEYKQEVASAVQRLGVKARAAGIHLVFAAQRPDVNVMPMQLRANLGNRLILRVDSEGTSEISLGEKGAERLLGKGHLLAKLEGSASLVYGQVPFASPTEIDQLVAMIRRSPM
jgi:S-DNA-T family DNA segregation ATPase FtsK/SpoIIIE